MHSFVIYTRMLTHYSTGISKSLTQLYALFLQVELEGLRCEAEVALDTIEIGGVIEREKGHSGFGQRWPEQDGLHHRCGYADQGSWSVDFWAMFAHSFEQEIIYLAKRIVFGSANCINLVMCASGFSQYFKDDGHHILDINGLEHGFAAADKGRDGSRAQQVSQSLNKGGIFTEDHGWLNDGPGEATI